MKLSTLEIQFAEASMGAIFPGSQAQGLADIRGMDVRGFLAQVMQCVPFQAALGLRAAIWLVALAPLFVVRRFATIRGLDQTDRERLVGRLVASPSYVIRSLVIILKTMGALLYAGDDGVRARMMPPAPRLVPVRIRSARAS